jgi:hypothetical protein
MAYRATAAEANERIGFNEQPSIGNAIKLQHVTHRPIANGINV